MPERIDSYDILIVGAGFSGMYALIKARELGLSALVLEAGSELLITLYILEVIENTFFI